MCCIKKSAYIINLFILINVTLVAQESEILKDTCSIPYLSDEIIIDSELKEEAWMNALILEAAYETFPSENKLSDIKTKALFFYNERYLYVGICAFDPHPEDIRARFNDRDRLMNDDHVILYFDTFNDERRAYSIQCNPFGIQGDDIRLPDNSSVAWEAIFESKARITSWGYIIEMAIPFNQIRFQRSKKDQIWGINIKRIYPREQNYVIDAVPIDRNNDSMISQFIKIKGFKEANPGKDLEFVPSVIAAKTDFRPEFPEGAKINQSKDLEAGISAKWGITPNLTLNATLNPDFSHVEADAYQLDINQPFVLFYPERRPFFQEGADYFRTLKNVLYTRVMREPVWGVKLTGKEEKNTIGVYSIQDELTNFIFPGSQGSSSYSLKENNLSTILRYKRDFGRNYTLGLMATDREGREYYNRMMSIDGDIRITNSDRIQVQFMGSSTKYSDSVAILNNQDKEKFNDHFFAFEYDHNGRNWGWWLDFDDAGPGFRADLGFIPMVGFRNVEGGLNYTWYGKPGSWWTRFNLNSEINYYEDYYRNPFRKNASLALSYSGPQQSMIRFTANKGRHLYNRKEFDLLSFNLVGRINLTADIRLLMFSTFGQHIDYTHTQAANRFQISSVLGFNIGKHLQMNIDHNYEKMNVNAGRLYTANISRITTIYQFSARMFFRAVLHYVDYNYNESNYSNEIDPLDKRIFSQLLFSYKINPYTVFLLGYSDNYRSGYQYNMTQADNTIFVKLSYALVM
ncbi:DUF5916 domain-containing protein [Bacteroidota bacterium]